MKRRHMTKRKSRKLFTRTASRSHRKNNASCKRGGYRI